MSFQLFDRIRAFLKSSSIYSHENLLQNQSDVNRAIDGDELINYSSAGLLDQTNLQINRMERYKDYDQMDEMGEISLALDLYADESTQIDPETKHSIGIRAGSKEVKEELESLFFDTLNIDKHIRPMSRYLCKYGDFAAEIIPNEDRSGVVSFRPFNIYSFLRVETKFGDLVGFFFTDEMMSEPIFLHPWQIMHQRLTSYENIYAPYGRSVLDGGRKDFRRLRLMEDAALIYRITRAPEKRVFTIPVGNIPTAQVQQYLNTIADQFKKQRFYDPATGDVNWRYAPLIQEDDFWLPQRPDGSGPKIDKLPGAENLDQIKDIEYFKKKMVAPLKIPFSRVGIGDDAGGNSDKSLASTHTDFAKAVQFVQREIAISLKKIAIVHLVLKGFSAQDISNFEITMTSSSAIDELYRIETWNSRAGVISTLKDTGLFPEEWILERFTDMSKDEIQELKDQKAKEAQKAPKEGMEDLLGGDEGGDLGLPGLEDLDKLESKVITEYAKMKERNKNSKITRYDDTFNYLINEKELDGIPFGKQENTGILTEEKETETSPEEIAKKVPIDPADAFNIIPEEIENTKSTINEAAIKETEDSYYIRPLDAYDQEAIEAKMANRLVLTQVIEKITNTPEEMTYQAVADDMDK